MTDALIGIGLGLAIGAGCRWLDVPVPAPPKVVGALLVVAVTLGFLGTDLALSRWGGQATNAAMAPPVPAAGTN